MSERIVTAIPYRIPDAEVPESSIYSPMRVWVEENIIGFKNQISNEDEDEEYTWVYYTKIRVEGETMTAQEYIKHLIEKTNHPHHLAVVAQIVEQALLE